jgi:hypothetical protein
MAVVLLARFFARPWASRRLGGFASLIILSRADCEGPIPTARDMSSSAASVLIPRASGLGGLDSFKVSSTSCSSSWSFGGAFDTSFLVDLVEISTGLTLFRPFLSLLVSLAGSCITPAYKLSEA